MRTMLSAVILAAATSLSIAPGIARADYECPADSNVCSHAVDTGSTSPVDLSGAGHTADKREWIVAPEDQFFVNATVTPQGSTGRNVHCEIGDSDGVQQRPVRVGDTAVTMTFTKRYLVIAHAETGSGPTNISHTAMMICNFSAQLAALLK